MLYEYRNIDEDAVLLKLVKRYYNEDSLTEEQLKYLGKLDGYSEKEIDFAINDYYLIYVRPKVMIEKLLVVSLCMSVVLFLIKIYFHLF